MKSILVSIEGLSDLLMNKFNDSSITVKAKKQVGVDQKTPEFVAENATYRDKDNNIFIPYTWLEGTLKGASVNFKMAGKGKKTYKNIIGSSVAVNPPEILLSPQKYEIFSIAAVNKIMKSRVMSHRPRFSNWSVEFAIDILDDTLSPEEIKPMLEYAGMYIGIGAWRPGIAGRYGKFQITKWEVIEK